MGHVLVTGGAGFIGSHIVEQMSGAGHEVHVLDNLSSGRRENLPADVKLHQMDICSPEARKFVSELAPSILIHTAAQISVRVSMQDPALDTQINLYGLTNILQAFHGGRLPYLVFTSTGGAIYGEQVSFPATETHQTNPCSIYGLAKLTSERYLEFWRQEWGLRYASLRLSNVYGPRQNPHGEAGVVAIFNQSLLSGKEPLINGTGEQTRDFIFVGDVARAVRLACGKQAAGVFNIGTGRETTIREIYDTIAKYLKSEGKRNHGPGKPGEQFRSVIDSRKASEEFGWEAQTSLEEGMRITSEWFSKQAGRN